jgi:transposase InsO family protein
MAEHGIAGIRLRRRVRTTVPEPADARTPDLLKRDFTAEQPNTKYVGDIAYLPLADGNNLYLATVIDCCSRKLAGWAVADHMRTSLVEDALNAARADRGSLRDAISTPTTEPSTPPRTSPLSAALSVSSSPSAASGRAPTTRSPSQSTRPSNE